MRGRELHDCSNCFERGWRRNKMESCLSFKVWTRGFDKRDIREFLALSLREKGVKWGENSDFAWTRGKWRGKVLEVLVILRKVKEEIRWSLPIACPSLGLWVCSHAWNFGFTCVEFQFVACGWNFYYTISCIMLN